MRVCIRQIMLTAAGALLMMACGGVGSPADSGTKAEVATAAPTSSPVTFPAGIHLQPTPNPTPAATPTPIPSPTPTFDFDVEAWRATIEAKSEEIGQERRAAAEAPVRAERERQLALSTTEAGRRLVFQGYVLLQSEGVPSVVQRAWGKHFDLYQNIFTMERGLGDIAEEITFQEFLQTSDTPGRPDLTYYRRLLQRVADLLEQPPPLDPDVSRYREALLMDPDRQFDLLETAFSPTIAPSLRGPVRRGLRERFGRASDVAFIQRGLGQSNVENPFATFLKEGGRFAGPDIDTYRKAVGSAADVLGAPIASLTSAEQELRDTLATDSQERQYQMAYQARLRDIPFEFRDAFTRRAREAFARWVYTAAAGD